MVTKTRLSRISERLREELSEILLMESSDPRLKGISVTDVTVDRELAFADIYVCTIEGSVKAQEVLNSLEHATGFLRRELAQRMDLRIFPKLRFRWDPTLEHAEIIENLIKEIHQTDDVKITSKKGRVEKHNASSA